MKWGGTKKKWGDKNKRKERKNESLSPKRLLFDFWRRRSVGVWNLFVHGG